MAESSFVNSKTDDHCCGHYKCPYIHWRQCIQLKSNYG